jgi:hypothetical protein
LPAYIKSSRSSPKLELPPSCFSAAAATPRRGGGGGRASPRRGPRLAAGVQPSARSAGSCLAADDRPAAAVQGAEAAEVGTQPFGSDRDRGQDGAVNSLPPLSSMSLGNMISDVIKFRMLSEGVVLIAGWPFFSPTALIPQPMRSISASC